MIISKEIADECRMIDRTSSLENSLNGEVEFTEVAQNLLLLDSETDEFCDKFASFSSMFKENCSSKIIEQLKSISFDEFLIYLLRDHQNPFIIQSCLRCIFIWISKCPESHLIFFNSEFALFISSIALSPETHDQRSSLLSFAILKAICVYNRECIPVLIENKIIKKLLNLYIDCPDEEVQAEILCTLYFLLKSKKIPFELAIDITNIFINFSSSPDDSHLSLILSLASSFAECHENCCFSLLECLPFDQFFISFDTFSNDEQADFIRLLISIFDNSNPKDLSTIIDYFQWDKIVSSFHDRPNNHVIIQYFATLLYSAFPKSHALIKSAFESEVFDILFLWTETEKYSIQEKALFALLQAFEYGFDIVGIPLLDFGLISKIILLLECNSTVLTKEICKFILILNDYAEKNEKNELLESLDIDCVIETLEIIENDEELPSDLLEIIKEFLEEIQIDQLWQ